MSVFPPDLTSPVGRVRKYIPDLRQDDGEYIFSDAEVTSFLLDTVTDDTADYASWQVFEAAAMAMIAIANDENLILKKLVTEDLQTDGPAVARALLESAKLYLKKADDLKGDEAEVMFIVDYQPTPSRYQPFHPWRY